MVHLCSYSCMDTIIGTRYEVRRELVGRNPSQRSQCSQRWLDLVKVVKLNAISPPRARARRKGEALESTHDEVHQTRELNQLNVEYTQAPSLLVLSKRSAQAEDQEHTQ